VDEYVSYFTTRNLSCVTSDKSDRRIFDEMFSSLDAKCLIRKPIENGKLIEGITEIIKPISTTERFGIDEA
jgi:hypothetical protein